MTYSGRTSGTTTQTDTCSRHNPGKSQGRPNEKHGLHGDRIYACREALGLDNGDRDPEKLRCDNFGLLGGEIVAIDYADQFPPLTEVWSWLLERLTESVR